MSDSAGSVLGEEARQTSMTGAVAPPRAQLDDLASRAIELGAEKAKVIDASSVAVEKWVALKCRYGCLFYDKDGYHPPYAPDPALMRDVLGEYEKAILISGPKGKALTEVATRLEGEAYDAGYYKAFALTSLSSGGDASGAT
jgi:predicted metal-binding protein